MADHEEAIRAVRAATKIELAALQAVALRLGRETSFAAHEAAKGMADMAEAGIGNAEVMSEAARVVLEIIDGATLATPIDPAEMNDG